MDLEVRHLKLVREVSAAGNLTRAGAALHLTQSALSHQLRDIESRLATPLFLRVGKRMALTAAGERVLQSADEILAAIEPTEDAVRLLAGADRGLLRVSTECYTCYHWLPPLLKRYRKSHPQVDVRIDPARRRPDRAPHRRHARRRHRQRPHQGSSRRGVAALRGRNGRHRGAVASAGSAAVLASRRLRERDAARRTRRRRKAPCISACWCPAA